MFISKCINSNQKLVYQVNLEEAYDHTAEMEIMPVSFQEDDEFRIEGEIIHLPGMCLIDERLSSENGGRVTFHVSGEHYSISLTSHWNFHPDRKDRIPALLPGVIDKDFMLSRMTEKVISPKQHFRNISFVFSAAYARVLLKNESWNHHDFLTKESSRYHIDISIKTILDELTGSVYQGIYQRPFFELKLKELFFKLHTQSVNLIGDPYIPGEIKEKIFAAKAFLISDFVKPPTIKQLSRIVSLNEFKLKQYFKSAFGITIHNFITKLRMQQAERMIYQYFSVAEISEKIGYKSVSHFIDTFKRHYGKTPKQASRDTHIPY